MFARLLSPLREFGPLAGMIYLLTRALQRSRVPASVYLYELMAQPVADAPLLRPGLRKGIVVREIGPGDPALARMPLGQATLDTRFAQPTVCLGAFRKDRLIAYMWLCLGAYDEDEVACRFVPSQVPPAAWDFDFYVFPEDRLGLGFASLWDDANAYLRARGYSYTCSRVNRFNTASRRSHARLHGQCVGRLLFLRALGVQAMLATVPPYLSVTADRAAPPAVSVAAPRPGTTASQSQGPVASA
jgi:hypothetical protein